MSDSSGFQLSRIYASGWIVGRKCTADDPAEIDSLADSLNPRQLSDEQERWRRGFKDAALRQFGLRSPSSAPERE